MWNQIAVVLEVLQRRCLASQNGKKHSDKKTCWQSVEFEEACKRKGCCDKVWQGTWNKEDYERNKKAKKEVKKIVRNTKSKAYCDLYTWVQENKRKFYACGI